MLIADRVRPPLRNLEKCVKPVDMYSWNSYYFEQYYQEKNPPFSYLLLFLGLALLIYGIPHLLSVIIIIHFMAQ